VGKWLQPFYDEVVPKVLAADSTHRVFYEDWVTDNFGYPMHVGVPPNHPWQFPDQALSYHNYCGYPVFSIAPCSQEEPTVFDQAAASRRRNHVASLLTEFGATEDLGVIGRLADLADRSGQGWEYWQYKTYFDPTTSAATTGAGADDESVVDDAGRLKVKKLAVLARAYPERIAGTDARWTFDAVTGRFELVYRPFPIPAAGPSPQASRRHRHRAHSRHRRRSRTGGRRRAHRGHARPPKALPPKVDTLISLPLSVHYPNGYAVAVNGGSIVSPPGSAIVDVRAQTGFGVVDVTIVPR
jgi:endoglycosylceramidase